MPSSIVALVTAALCALSTAQPAFLFPVTLDRLHNTVDSRFLSLAFDASVMRGADPFGFFSSARVATLLTGLTPAYFRFSGTEIDSMTFNETADCDNKAPPFCLNATQLTNVLNLTSVSGMDLVLGVNGRVGKSADAPNAPWDSANAKVLLAWVDGAVAALGIPPPFAWELGNEPDLWPWTQNGSHLVNGTQLSSDVDQFRTLVSGWSHLAPNGTVTTFGPDTCNCYNGDVVLEEFARGLNASAAPSTRALTWHFYNSGGSTAAEMVSIDKADSLIGRVQQAFSDVAASRNPAALGVPVIIGETGECANGGCTQVPSPTTLPELSIGMHRRDAPQPVYYSESFLDSFLFLDKLGLAAAMNGRFS